MLAGTALAGLIFSIFFSRLTGGMDMKDFMPGEHTEQFIIAMKRSFQAAAVIAAAAMAASWWRGEKEDTSGAA